jgi:hypothetical protein
VASRDKGPVQGVLYSVHYGQPRFYIKLRPAYAASQQNAARLALILQTLYPAAQPMEPTGNWHARFSLAEGETAPFGTLTAGKLNKILAAVQDEPLITVIPDRNLPLCLLAVFRYQLTNVHVELVRRVTADREVLEVDLLDASGPYHGYVLRLLAPLCEVYDDHTGTIERAIRNGMSFRLTAEETP